MTWERLGAGLVLQQYRPTPLEDRLLRAEVLRASPVRQQTFNAGSSQATAVILGDLAAPFTAYHKPLEGVDEGQAAGYGHDPRSAIINECAAWLMAKSLGSPYREMVPDVVVRSIWPSYSDAVGGFGTLSIEAPGSTNRPEPLQDPAECDPAAFFDALIAQQDRHATNYRWQPGQLGLLDNAYSFAAPGYLAWASVFVEARHGGGRSELDPAEIYALERLQSTQAEPIWMWLRMMLREDQVEALESRIARMVESGRLLQPGEF